MIGHLNANLLACQSYIYLYRLYGRTIVEHIARGGRCVNDILGGIDDTLGKIAGVAHDPLRFRCKADEETAHTQHEDFLFHNVTVLIGE